jgi:hypothetical protein
MRVSLNEKMPPDPVPHNAPALKVTSPKGLALPKAPKVRLKVPGFNSNKTSMLGGKAMKSPEDYETGQGVAGLGKAASPYYQQQYAKKGQSLKYDTITNTYR